jgi:hypothetical protein
MYPPLCCPQGGALRREGDMAKAIDLTGQKFGRLTVMGRAGAYVRPNGQTGHATWDCLCECGNRVIVMGRLLRIEATKSCGCLRKELTRERSTTHGMRGTPEYTAYRQAMARCTNPKNRDYPRYGGIGIRFLFSSFEEFYEEVGPRPAKTDARVKRQWSLERINNKGNYEPGNVKWATYKEQANNRTYANARRIAALEARIAELEVLLDLEAA